MQQYEEVSAGRTLPVGDFANFKTAGNGFLECDVQLRIGQGPEQIQVSQQGMA